MAGAKGWSAAVCCRLVNMKEFYSRTHIMSGFCKHVLDTSNTSNCRSGQPLSKVMTQQHGLGDRAAFPRPLGAVANSRLRRFCRLVRLSSRFSLAICRTKLGMGWSGKM